MKTAIINEILNIREYDGQNGLIYYFKLKMDNGEIGEIGKKSKAAFKVGDSLTYTATESNYGLNFKEVKQNGFSGKQSAESMASVALRCSSELTAAFIAAGETNGSNSTQLADVTLTNADKYLIWLKANQ